MDDKARALQSEVDRLAAKLGVEPLSVGVIRTNDDYNIFIDENGFYHYAYYERGQLAFDRVGDLDDVLYWYSVLADLCGALGIANVGNVSARIDQAAIRHADISSGGQRRRVTVVTEAGMYEVIFRSDNSIVFSMASRSTGNRADLFYSEYQMMERLNPGWGKRRVRDTASMFRRNKTPEDIALLPDIGEEL
ncbi:BRO family protein [Mycobacteroides abscessus]